MTTQGSGMNFNETAQLLPDRYKLIFRQTVEAIHEKLAKATARRVARQQWLVQIREYAEPLDVSSGYWGDLAPGTMVVALCTWSRDCDMCEGTSVRLVEATPKALAEAMERDFESAEGPMRHWLQRASDEFEPEFRDGALEAYEDGHPHIIY